MYCFVKYGIGSDELLPVRIMTARIDPGFNLVKPILVKQSYNIAHHQALLIQISRYTGSGRLWGGHLHCVVPIRHASACPSPAHATGSRQPGVSVPGAVPGPETFSTGLLRQHTLIPVYSNVINAGLIFIPPPQFVSCRLSLGTLNLKRSCMISSPWLQ